MLHEPIYDPGKSYQENRDQGPFGAFADGSVLEHAGGRDHSAGPGNPTDTAAGPAAEPNFTLFDRPIAYPFGIPAGPLLNGAYIEAALDKGFDIPVHKTLRSREHPSHPWPNVLGVRLDGELTLERAREPLVAAPRYEEPLSITNSFGNPSHDPVLWQPELADAVSYARPGQLVMASFEGTKRDGMSAEEYIEDWVHGIELIAATGVTAAEVNFSCPNEGTSELLCFDIPKVERICRAIKERVSSVALVVKLAYFEETPLRELVRSVGPLVDGFSAINTISAPVVDPRGGQALPGAGRERSGICGHAIKWAGLDMVRRLAALRAELALDFEIIGVGGVMKPVDFREYRDAGADAVMSATAAMWNPYLAQEIKAVYPEG